MNLAKAKILTDQLFDLRFEEVQEQDIIGILGCLLDTANAFDPCEIIKEFGVKDIATKTQELSQALQVLRDSDCDVTKLSRVDRRALEQSAIVFDGHIKHNQSLVEFCLQSTTPGSTEDEITQAMLKASTIKLSDQSFFEMVEEVIENPDLAKPKEMRDIRAESFDSFTQMQEQTTQLIEAKNLIKEIATSLGIEVATRQVD